jgi:hypothetical protein
MAGQELARRTRSVRASRCVLKSRRHRRAQGRGPSPAPVRWLIAAGAASVDQNPGRADSVAHAGSGGRAGGDHALSRARSGRRPAVLSEVVRLLPPPVESVVVVVGDAETARVEKKRTSGSSGASRSFAARDDSAGHPPQRQPTLTRRVLSQRLRNQTSGRREHKTAEVRRGPYKRCGRRRAVSLSLGWDPSERTGSLHRAGKLVSKPRSGSIRSGEAILRSRRFARGR